MFNPYSVEEIKGVYYIKVLTYNRTAWYPWGYLYLAEGYPVSKANIKYARKFSSSLEAENFIKQVFN